MLTVHPVYSGHPAATLLFSALVAVWVTGEVAIRLRSLLRTGAQQRDRGSYLVIVGSLLMGFGGGAFLASVVPGAASALNGCVRAPQRSQPLSGSCSLVVIIRRFGAIRGVAHTMHRSCPNER